MNYQKAANLARSTMAADSTPTSAAQIANGLIDTKIGTLRAYISHAASTLGRLIVTNGLLLNVQDALTADTGSAQAGATKITSSVARFTTVGTSGDSAVLPAAAPGIEITVINASATSMDVFPAGSDAINGLSASAAFALAGGTSATFYSTVAAHWNTVASPAAAFSPSVTGTLSLSDATTPALSLASGSTNTGTITVNGKTSGSLILTTADATGQAVTIKPAAQTSGAVTLTTPDFAGVNDTFAFITKAQTLINKTLSAPVINGATSASGNFDLSGSSGTTKTTTGRTTIGGALSHNTVNTAVAATGSTNSDAAALTSVRVQHVSSDSAAKGVKLPVGVAGDVLTIINDSSTACKIYPDAGGNVNGGTVTSGSVTVPASKGVVAHCTVALTWIVYDLPAKSA